MAMEFYRRLKIGGVGIENYPHFSLIQLAEAALAEFGLKIEVIYSILFFYPKSLRDRFQPVG